MPTEPPPPRYRVVERGRRLEVIDTLIEETASPDADAAGLADRVRPRLPGADRVLTSLLSAPTQAEQARGTAGELTTHLLYDAKGPRTLRLDDAGAATIERVKLVAAMAAIVLLLLVIAASWLFLVPLFIAFQPKIVRRARTGITRWLDRYDPLAT